MRAGSPGEKHERIDVEKDPTFRFSRRWRHFSVFGVGGKYGMRKEGREAQGMTEHREGQSNEERDDRGSCCLPLCSFLEVRGDLLHSQGSCSERQPFFSAGPG